MVRLLDSGIAPTPYLVMEMVPGDTLSALSLPLSAEAVVGIVAHLADALAAMHAAGVVHGDVKPANIVLASSGTPVLVDVGGAGSHGGTWAYASYERLAGEASSAAADVFALGVLTWELLQGTPPWPHGASAAMERPDRAPACDTGPEWLRTLVDHLLDPDPGLRPSAADVADRCEAHGTSVGSPPLALLEDRGRTTYVRRPRLDDTIDERVMKGLSTLIVGPSGSGRTHVLQRLRRHAEAHGRRFRWVTNASGLVNRPARPRRAAAEGRDTLLLVDALDAQGPDLQSRIRRAANRGATVVATSTAPLSGPWRVVNAGALDDAGCAAFCHALLGRGSNHDLLAEAAHTARATQPGHLRTFVLDAVAKGVVSYQNHQWIADRLSLGAFAKRWRSARPGPGLDGLDPVSHRAAIALVTRGRPVGPETLAVVLDVSAVDALRALRHLEDLGIATEADEAWHTPPSLDLEACAPDEARRMHARWLELSTCEEHVDWEVVAHHLVDGSDPDAITRWAEDAIAGLRARDPVLAADVATGLVARAPTPTLRLEQVRALVDAANHDLALRAAAELADDTSLPDDVRARAASVAAQAAGVDLRRAAEGRSWIRRAERLGAHPMDLATLEARIAFTEGELELAKDLARPMALLDPPAGPLLDAWLGAVGVIAECLLTAGDTAGAQAILDTVPDELGRGRAERGRLDGTRGRAFLHGGRLREAASAFAAAVRPDSGLSCLGRARVLNNSAGLAYQMGERQLAVERWEEALLLFERLGDALECVRVRTNLTLGYREVGRYERARQAGAWAVRVGHERQWPVYEAMAAGNLVDVFLATGDLDGAERWWHRAWHISMEHGLGNELLELKRRRARTAVLRDGSDALHLALDAIEAAWEAQDELEAARACGIAGLCYARQGREADAREVIETALEVLTRVGAAGDLAVVRLDAARSYVALGLIDEAREMLALADTFAREVGHLDLARDIRDLGKQVQQLTTPSSTTEGMHSLLDVVSEVRDAQSTEEALEAALHGAVKIVAAQLVVVTDAAGRELGRAGPSADGDRPSRSIIERCLRTGREIVISDVTERSDLRSQRSVSSCNLRSVACLPIAANARVVGTLYVHSQRRDTQDLGRNVRLLRALAVCASQPLTVHVLGTEHRLLEAELDRSERVRDAVLATVSHELRTPLQAIVGQTPVLSDPDLPQQVRQAAGDVDRAARRLLGTINDMLTFATFGAGGEIRSQPFRPVDVLERVIAQATTRAEAKGLSFEARLSGPLEHPLSGPAPLLEQLLSRLLDNALKFTQTGCVEVVVAARERAHGTVSLLVRDTGPGIDPAQLTSVFQPFAVGGDPRTRASQGVGLGLAICQRIAQHLGGELELESTREGTVVWTDVRFEVAPVARRKRHRRAEAPRRVLVVDDNDVNRRVLARMVQRQSFEVDTAPDGEAAIHLVEQHDYYAILMDWHMPGIDGIEATRRIRRSGPRRDVPVALVTADQSPGVRDNARAAGVDIVAFKPIGPAQLGTLMTELAALWDVDEVPA